MLNRREFNSFVGSLPLLGFFNQPSKNPKQPPIESSKTNRPYIRFYADYGANAPIRYENIKLEFEHDNSPINNPIRQAQPLIYDCPYSKKQRIQTEVPIIFNLHIVHALHYHFSNGLSGTLSDKMLIKNHLCSFFECLEILKLGIQMYYGWKKSGYNSNVPDCLIKIESADIQFIQPHVSSGHIDFDNFVSTIGIYLNISPVVLFNDSISSCAS